MLMEKNILFFSLDYITFSGWTSSKYSWNFKSMFVLPGSNSASLNKQNEFHKLDMNSLTSAKV